MSPDWLRPQWPAPARVHAVCTTRAGGQSAAPYGTLNLGAHVGDQAQAVAANRVLFEQAIAARPVFLSQVHGANTVWLSDASAHDTPADGSITGQPGVACTVMVADCLPVLLTNSEGTLVAAAHAGWRGLLGEGGHGILEAVLQSFKPANGHGASGILAWLGPCIGAQAFEVGAEVRELFVAQDRAAVAMFRPTAGEGLSGKWLADLPGLARLRLAALGVTQLYGNDGTPSWCTVRNPARFFSHRRDRVSGRMVASIWLA